MPASRGHPPPTLALLAAWPAASPLWRALLLVYSRRLLRPPRLPTFTYWRSSRERAAWQGGLQPVQASQLGGWPSGGRASAASRGPLAAASTGASPAASLLLNAAGRRLLLLRALHLLPPPAMPRSPWTPVPAAKSCCLSGCAAQTCRAAAAKPQRRWAGAPRCAPPRPPAPMARRWHWRRCQRRACPRHRRRQRQQQVQVLLKSRRSASDCGPPLMPGARMPARRALSATSAARWRRSSSSCSCSRGRRNRTTSWRMCKVGVNFFMFLSE